MINRGEKMKTIAIICEYNPFHGGHAHQLARLRDAYPDAVLLCIMSGCFTQRGEPAILPPYARAQAAIGGGADLVLELPQPWASASAEYFAAGGVAVAHGLGCVDGLSFGCESADADAPMRVAEGLDSSPCGNCSPRHRRILRRERPPVPRGSTGNMWGMTAECSRRPTIFLRCSTVAHCGS